MMFPLLLLSVFAASTAGVHAACVDEHCQGAIKTNSLLQSGNSKTKFTGSTLEDTQWSGHPDYAGFSTYYGLCADSPISMSQRNAGQFGMGSPIEERSYAGVQACHDACVANPSCKSFQADWCTNPKCDGGVHAGFTKDMRNKCRLFSIQAKWGWSDYNRQQVCYGSPGATPAPTAQPTTNPTAEPTAYPTADPTAAEDFHARKVTEHGSYQTQFTGDCEPCITAEKYAADNATECTRKHTEAQQDAVSVGEAESALAACKEKQLTAKAAAADAKTAVTVKLAQITSALAGDDTGGTKEGASELCTELMDDWIAKKNAVVSCDEESAKLAQSKAAYDQSGAAAKACDGRAETAKAQALVECANLMDADPSQN